MSHAVEMEFKPESVASLKKACERLGYAFCEGRDNIHTMYENAWRTGNDHVIDVHTPWHIGVRATEDGKFQLVGDEYLTPWVDKVATEYAVVEAEAFAAEFGYEIQLNRKSATEVEITMVDMGGF